MQLTIFRSILLAIVIGLAAVFNLLGLMTTSPVLAEGLEVDEVTRQSPLEQSQSGDNPDFNETFSFIATFQNNGDGTVWVRYETSIPETSLIIPTAPGTFRINSG